MSSSAFPITPARFAAALIDLPISSLYAKATELDNSISHLQDSNANLLPFAEDGDLDCSQAIEENQDVITRMRERIRLLRLEVEKRSRTWHELQAEVQDRQMNGDAEMSESSTTNGDVDADHRLHGNLNGDGSASERPFGDGDSARTMERTQESHEDEDGHGIHL
ncbi:hypothetical protein MMC14_008426 [Varicellaria rhodocarpa]|nr:hypothetical protein [Varicellaria rhodocarpa]